MDITVIVPLFNEEESLQELYSWIERVMKQNSFSFQVLFVDDGSTDGSALAVLADECAYTCTYCSACARTDQSTLSGIAHR